MFCTILTVGLLLLFIDVTLIQLILLLVLLAVVLPFLLGLVTLAEVRAAFESFKENRLKKVGILKKLDEIKLFEKKGAKKPESAPAKVPARPESAPAKPAAGKMPFGSQIGSLVASIKSLGTVIRERTRRERKVADINKMLDSTITEKVEKSSSPAKSPAGAAPFPAPGGSGSPADADPFLSLSDDEFDSGLLDGLDEGDLASPGLPGEGDLPMERGLSGSVDLPEPELSMPDLEMDAAAADILKANAGDDEPAGFSGLEAVSDSDTDFGDLDNISLDDVDLDADLDLEDSESSDAGPDPESPQPAAAAPAQEAEPPGAVKTAWIPSDAPGNANLAEDQIGMQSDMAAFASSSGGTDEDLLSSIASDVKHVTKEKDVSLLRELKDFKAPAEQIEKELTEMYQRMNVSKKPKDKPESATNEIK